MSMKKELRSYQKLLNFILFHTWFAFTLLRDGDDFVSKDANLIRFKVRQSLLPLISENRSVFCDHHSSYHASSSLSNLPSAEVTKSAPCICFDKLFQVFRNLTILKRINRVRESQREATDLVSPLQSQSSTR